MCVCVKERGGTVLSVEILSRTSNCYSPFLAFFVIAVSGPVSSFMRGFPPIVHWSDILSRPLRA